MYGPTGNMVGKNDRMQNVVFFNVSNEDIIYSDSKFFFPGVAEFFSVEGIYAIH